MDNFFKRKSKLYDFYLLFFKFMEVPNCKSASERGLILFFYFDDNIFAENFFKINLIVEKFTIYFFN